jgi:hypothetical protein
MSGHMVGRKTTTTLVYWWKRVDGRPIPKAHLDQLAAEAERKSSDAWDAGFREGELRAEIPWARRHVACAYRGWFEIKQEFDSGLIPIPKEIRELQHG